jgi:hypothetical protein
MPAWMAGMAHNIADEYLANPHERDKLERDITNAMKESAREVALFFAAYPEHTKEIPVPENMPLKAARFWQEVYIAAVRAGQSQTYAKACAQQAMTDFLKLVSETK